MREQTQKIIGQNLRILRTSHGLTQDEMATIIGCSRPLYTHYEAGRRAHDCESLFTVAAHFGIDMSSLFEPEMHDFLNIIANGINTAEQFSEITHIYNQLSPYSRGRLAERARALLDEEIRRRERGKAIMEAPFL